MRATGGKKSPNAGLAPDCLQRPLRSRFQQQVKPGVRLAKAIFLGSWKEEEAFPLEVGIEGDSPL
jgi:hypothetical protein